MVRIALSGASGNVSNEIYDALVERKKHEIVLLSRKDKPNDFDLPEGVTWAKVDYNDVDQLKEALQSVHTVLCFITSHTDPENVAQKNLIDASIKAGVIRFAPSEWTGVHFDNMPMYAGKIEMREYLRKINENGKVLEYSLFIPGTFTNYLAAPHKTAKHVHAFQSHLDVNNRQAIVTEGADNAKISFITVKDFREVVARAIEYEGEWPVMGGMQGDVLTVGQVIKLGEKIRGSMALTTLRKEDVEKGIINSPWLPKIDHPSITPEMVEVMSKMLVQYMLLSTATGAFDVPADWNRIFPDMQFTPTEDFLRDVFEGKP